MDRRNGRITYLFLDDRTNLSRILACPLYKYIPYSGHRRGLQAKQLILDRPFISRTKILHTQFLDRGSGIIHDYEIRFTAREETSDSVVQR